VALRPPDPAGVAKLMTDFQPKAPRRQGPISGGSPDVALYSDVAPFADNRFDCRDLFQRRVIHHGDTTATIEDQDDPRT
jgi:hypothetical protein